MDPATGEYIPGFRPPIDIEGVPAFVMHPEQRDPPAAETGRGIVRPSFLHGKSGVPPP
jgi:hypothetical protein